MAAMLCSNCRWWKKDRTMDGKIGECRRLAPAHGVPKTRADFWCGCFREANLTERATRDHDEGGLSWYGHGTSDEREE